MYSISKTGNTMAITPETGNTLTFSKAMSIVGNVDRVLFYDGAQLIFTAFLSEISTIDDIEPAAELEDVLAQVAAIMPESNYSAAPVLAVATSLSATPGDTVASLDWTNGANATVSEVQVSENADFSDATTYNVSAPTHAQALTGLTNDTEYNWRVRMKAPNYIKSAWVVGTPFTPVAEE